jgi:hypothetical protein
MNGSAPRLYRAALWLYPPSFRREFSADLHQAFRDLHRDRGALTTTRRSIADLTLSIPTQHMEALMARTSAPVVTLTSAAVLLAAIAAAVTFGYPVVALAPLAIAAGAMVVYRRSQTPYREAVRDNSRLWIRFLGAGLGLFAVLIGASGVRENWDWFPWQLLVVSVMVGWALIGTGLLLGVVNLVHRVNHRPAGG